MNFRNSTGNNTGQWNKFFLLKFRKVLPFVSNTSQKPALTPRLFVENLSNI